MLLGPLPFLVTFALIEAWKMLLFFIIGAANVSTFVQTAFILDIRLDIKLTMHNNWHDFFQDSERS